MPKPIFFCSLFSFCRESCEDWGVWIRARMAAGTPGLGGRGLPRCIYAYMLMSCFVSSVRSSLRFNVPVEIPDDHDGHDGLPVTMHCNVFIFTQPNTTVALNCYKMINQCSWGQFMQQTNAPSHITHIPICEQVMKACMLSSPFFQWLEGHQPPAWQPHLLCLDQHPIGLHTGASSSDKIKV